MSSFSVDWLSLRAAADARSRSAELMAAAAAAVRQAAGLSSAADATRHAAGPFNAADATRQAAGSSSAADATRHAAGPSSAVGGRRTSGPSSAADAVRRAAGPPGADGMARIVDLGSGTGATLRALSPLIGRPQHWTLVDADAALLDEAVRITAAALPAPDLTVATLLSDLAADPAPWPEPAHLVTASALFDLVSAGFVDALAGRLGADRVPLLACLTYDGRLVVSPAHELDQTMAAAFNTHQRGTKSFGTALGPDAVPTLAAALREKGFTVTLRDSAWRLDRAADGPLMDAMLAGWASAACEILPEQAGPIAGWLTHALGADRLVVGHTDLLALP